MNNPYASPGAAVTDIASDDEPYQPRIFSTQGRIGRLRYLAYATVATFAAVLVIGVLGALLMGLTGSGDSGTGTAIMFGALYIPVLAISFIMAKRRLNDLDQSGWLSLLLLVPLLNLVMALYLVFWPGSAGSNRYGPKPVANHWALVILALLVPLAGIVAAISIPAYQEYTKRAQAAQLQQLPQP